VVTAHVVVSPVSPEATLRTLRGPAHRSVVWDWGLLMGSGSCANGVTWAARPSTKKRRGDAARRLTFQNRRSPRATVG